MTSANLMKFQLPNSIDLKTRDTLAFINSSQPYTSETGGISCEIQKLKEEFSSMEYSTVFCASRFIGAHQI